MCELLDESFAAVPWANDLQPMLEPSLRMTLTSHKLLSRTKSSFSWSLDSAQPRSRILTLLPMIMKLDDNEASVCMRASGSDADTHNVTFNQLLFAANLDQLET
jgi:hypothetical protein